MNQIKKTLPLLGVLFLGYFGFALSIPIFPLLFLGDSPLPAIAEFSIGSRRILLGILFAMYPLGQFLGNPVLGSLSDKYGRKPLLLISLACACPMFLICSVAIHYNLLILLFIARFLCGLFEGNVVIAQSSLSDLSESSHSKKKNFTWIISISSVGFLCGPLVGGLLANHDLSPYFSLATPFIAASFLFFLSFINVLLFFKESLHPDNRSDTLTSIISILTSFKEMLMVKSCRKIYFSNTINFIGVFFFLNFFSSYLVTRFHLTIQSLSVTNAALSVCFIISPLLIPVFFKKTSLARSLALASSWLALSLCLFVSAHNMVVIYLSLMPIAFCLSICFAYAPLMISEQVSNSIQGKALGANMSLQMLSETLTAFIGGGLMAITPELSTLAGIFFLLLASLAYRRFKPQVSA